MVARSLFIVSGLICLLAGLVGVVLPLLPGTPLLILAAFFFSRSSPALHRWLLALPGIGQVIAEWGRHGTISPRGKRAVTASLIILGTLTMLLTRSLLASVIFVAVAAAVLAYIWTRPSFVEPSLDGTRPS